jgi:hypothetical protein
LADARHEHAEAKQIATGVIERLTRQFLWPFDAGGLRFRDIEAGRRLHQ